MSELKKMAFWQINGGKLGVQMQGEFEQAQITAREMNGKVVVTLNITIYPPDAADERFGHISYSTSVKNPPKVSPMFTTELREGIIINDGENMDDLLQTCLELPMTTKERGVKNG